MAIAGLCAFVSACGGGGGGGSAGGGGAPPGGGQPLNDTFSISLTDVDVVRFGDGSAIPVNTASVSSGQKTLTN